MWYAASTFQTLRGKYFQENHNINQHIVLEQLVFCLVKVFRVALFILMSSKYCNKLININKCLTICSEKTGKFIFTLKSIGNPY